MSCNVKGTGCRVCPGVWLAGILLLISLFQSLFSHNSERAGEELPSTEVQSHSAQ